MFLDITYFMARYVPFWAVPSFIISFQYAYIYWLKDMRKASILLMAIAGFSAISLIFYIWSGGTDLAPQMIEEIMRSY